VRTLSEIQEASRFGEPVTEQELRYALEACRCLLVMLHNDLAHFAADDSMTMPKVKSKSNHHWEMIKRAHGGSPEKWLGPDNLPGNPDLKKRAEIAAKIMERAQRKNGN
jgi:hypothetical protein